MEFEWDDAEDRSRRAKRGFGFADVLPAFANPAQCIKPDTRQAYGEARYVLFGRVAGRLFVIVFTDRAGRRPIISARKASARERRDHGDCEGKVGS